MNAVRDSCSLTEVGDLLDFGYLKGCRLGGSLLRRLHGPCHLHLLPVVAQERVVISLENVANAVGSGETEGSIEAQHAAGERGRGAAGLLGEGGDGNEHEQ